MASKISPQLNDKISKIAQEKYKKNNGKTKEDFDKVYDETIKEFGYEPKYFKDYMKKYFTPFEDGDFMQESVNSKTKKITLTELRSLVKNIVKEEQSKKKRVIKENKDDLIDFVVPQHYGSALIDGDFSGLEDEDEEKLNEFIDDVLKKFGNANFMLGDDEDMDLGFMTRSDIDNLGGDMMRVFIKPDRPMQESIKPKTQKIKLSEVRQLVRKIIKEDNKSNIPLKNGIISYLKNIYGSEFDEFAAEAALYWYGYNYHEGQYSPLYQILSTSDYKPSPLANDIDDEDETTQMYYHDILGEFEGISEYGDEPIQESIKPKTQKIKLSEVRQLVRKMIKEEYNNDFNKQVKEMFNSLDLFIINGQMGKYSGAYQTEKKDNGTRINFGFENIDDELPLMKFNYEGKNYKMPIPKSTITNYIINKIKSIINKNEAHKIKIGESEDPKSWGVGSFGVTKDVDLGENPFESLEPSLKTKENLLKRVLKLSDKFNIGYAGNGHFENQVVMQIMRKVRNDINKVTDSLIEDVLFYMEDHYDF